MKDLLIAIGTALIVKAIVDRVNEDGNERNCNTIINNNLTLSDDGELLLISDLVQESAKVHEQLGIMNSRLRNILFLENKSLDKQD